MLQMIQLHVYMEVWQKPSSTWRDFAENKQAFRVNTLFDFNWYTLMDGDLFSLNVSVINLVSCNIFQNHQNLQKWST